MGSDQAMGRPQSPACYFVTKNSLYKMHTIQLRSLCYSTNGVRMCVAYWGEFMVSEKMGPMILVHFFTYGVC